METKEYIVCLNRNIDYDQFWNEIENESGEDGFTPSRRVEIINNRDASMRQCHYALTDEEAENLKNDPRIYSVEEPTKFKPMLFASQNGVFTKTTSNSGNYQNWGLRRVIEPTNIYGTGSTASGAYTYSLDGSGVDIVIQDSGIEVNHPEFQDENGTSRVVTHDWFAVSGVSGTQSANHYRDYYGHGTHVAGIAAGKTFGWAKNAKIYSVKVGGLEGSGDSGTGINQPACFDVILGWHNNKPVDPITGLKRPTIVNMSWGYSDWFVNMSGGNYRGTTWTGTQRRPDYGMIGWAMNAIQVHNVRVAYIDALVEEMIDAGIHVTISAGNSYQKADIPGGIDYNNYYVGGYFNGYTPNYYHRGGSPFANGAFYVGSIDYTVHSAELDQKSVFSNSGPLVNIWAPGSKIMSACSTTNELSGVSYYLNSSYKQINISGTSMASPQVCGLGALFLQLEPSLTPAQLRDKIIKASKSVIYDTGIIDDYLDQRSIQGSSNHFLYNPFSDNKTIDINNIDLTTFNIQSKK